MRADLNAARKDRDKHRTMLLTTILSDLKYQEVELKRDATDAEVIDVVKRGVKRRKEASEQMRAGNRPELADKEDLEAEMLAVYLPAQLGEDNVREFIRDAIAGGATNVGAVMAAVMPKLKGAFDGKEANRIAREMLGG